MKEEVESVEISTLPTGRGARGGKRGLPAFGRSRGSRAAAAAGFLAALCLGAVSAKAQSMNAGAPAEQTVQMATPPVAANAGPPLTLSLADALKRAQQNSPQFQAAVAAARDAHEAHVQAHAAMLPVVSGLTQYLNTQGNGISPVGRFTTNDGVHVYREWAVVHQGMPGSFFIDGAPRQTAFLAAAAREEQEVALRGLNVTVTQDYYALLVAQRGYAIAQQGLASARHFLQIGEELEKGGEVAHADVIRLQLLVSQAQRALQNAELTMSEARMNLAVLMFPTFNENFTVVDDLDTPPVLPGFQQVQAMAGKYNPDLAAALDSYHAAGVSVAMAKSAFFPSFAIDFDYGIEANAFALHSVNTDTGVDRIRQPNLGYFVTYTMNLPVWDWGTLRSQLHQAEDAKELARLNLSYAQKQLLNNLYADYNEAATAWNQLSSLQQSVNLAQQNFRLVTMQYQAGQVTVLDVLDAQSSLADARNSYAAGEARYRNALATLQTVTGSF
jgi:outer membrane protein TolC